VQLEARLGRLEGNKLASSAGSAKGKPKIEAYNKDRKNGGLVTPAKVIFFASFSAICYFLFYFQCVLIKLFSVDI
jgi:nucleolar protein 58